MYEPKHRKNALTKTEPRIQPAGRHIADRTLERLGAEAPNVRWLFEAAFGPNPFRRLS